MLDGVKQVLWVYFLPKDKSVRRHNRQWTSSCEGITVPEIWKRGVHLRTCRCTSLLTSVKVIASWSLNQHQNWTQSAQPLWSYWKKMRHFWYPSLSTWYGRRAVTWTWRWTVTFNKQDRSYVIIMARINRIKLNFSNRAPTTPVLERIRAWPTVHTYPFMSANRISVFVQMCSTVGDRLPIWRRRMLLKIWVASFLPCGWSWRISVWVVRRENYAEWSICD